VIQGLPVLESLPYNSLSVPGYKKLTTDITILSDLIETNWILPAHTPRSSPPLLPCLASHFRQGRVASVPPAPALCVCLLLQDLVQICLHGGGGNMGGHVLRETTSRGLCGLGCPSRTSERGGEGDCVKGGGGEEGKCERERALERLRYYNPGH
jgi:hypothetical protein